MKVKAAVTYAAVLDIGDLPWQVVTEALEADEGNGPFNLFEQGTDITISGVELDEVKSK